MIFRQDFEAEVWSLFCATDAWFWLWSSILVEILKLGLVKICKFCWDADAWLRFWSWCLVEILKICVRTCDMTDMTLRSYFGKQNSTLGSVVPLAMFTKFSQHMDSLQASCWKVAWPCILYIVLTEFVFENICPDLDKDWITLKCDRIALCLKQCRQIFLYKIVFVIFQMFLVKLF